MTDRTETLADALQGQADGHPGVVGEQVDGSSSATIGADTGNQSDPSAAPQYDFSFLGKDVQADIANLDHEALGTLGPLLEKLKPNVMMQADHTRKTQKLAQQRAELEKRGQFAQLGERVANDPALLHAVTQAISGFADSQKETEVDYDEMFDLTPNSFGKKMEERMEMRARQIAEEIAEKKVSNHPAIKRAKLSSELEAYGSTLSASVPKEQFNAAVLEMNRELMNSGQDITQYTVQQLMPVLAPHIQLQQIKAAGFKQPSIPKTRAASLTSGGASQPVQKRRPYEDEQGNQTRPPTTAESFRYEGTASVADLKALAAAAQRELGLDDD